jgi:hypothetical protein
MKKYRCVFTYTNGRTSIEVQADNADRALLQAVEMINPDSAEALEVWDETGLVYSEPASRLRARKPPPH